MQSEYSQWIIIAEIFLNMYGMRYKILQTFFSPDWICPRWTYITYNWQRACSTGSLYCGCNLLSLFFTSSVEIVKSLFVGVTVRQKIFMPHQMRCRCYVSLFNISNNILLMNYYHKKGIKKWTFLDFVCFYRKKFVEFLLYNCDEL